jgi:hypothetical protein
VSHLKNTNNHLPRTIGDGMIHQSHIDTMVECDFPIPELKKGKPSEEEEKIGKLIADNLVEDGATLQMDSTIASICDWWIIPSPIVLGKCLLAMPANI